MCLHLYADPRVGWSWSANQVADCFVELFSRQGLPREILTDHGKQFIDSALKRVCKYFAINKMTTSPYHPQGNRKRER